MKPTVSRFLRKNQHGIDGADYWFEVALDGGGTTCEVAIRISGTALLTEPPGIPRPLTASDYVLLARMRIDERIGQGFLPLTGVPPEVYRCDLQIDSSWLRDNAGRIIPLTE